MMDKRLLALAPEALWHVLATVAWQWVGLVATWRWSGSSHG